MSSECILANAISWKWYMTCHTAHWLNWIYIHLQLSSVVIKVIRVFCIMHLDYSDMELLFTLVDLIRRNSGIVYSVYNSGVSYIYGSNIYQPWHFCLNGILLNLYLRGTIQLGGAILLLLSRLMARSTSLF